MDETEFDIRSIFGLLRRQLRLIVITVIAVVALAGVVTFSLTPIYSSSALIMVDPSNKNLLDPETQGTSAGADSARIDSEVELVRSDNVLLKVIESQNLLADEEFGVSLGAWTQIMGFLRLADPALPSGEDALNQSLNRLRGAVSVQRRGLTYLISVQVHSENRGKAADLANAIAQAYISDQLASKVNSTLASRDILQARITQARTAISSSESSFDNFISENITRITEDTGRTDIANMHNQLQQLETARTQQSAVADTVQQALNNGDLDTLVANLQGDATAELKRQRETLTRTLQGTDANSPVAVDLRKELTSLESQLKQSAEAEVTSLRTTVQQSQAQEDTLRQNMRTQVLNSSLSADVLTRLYELQQSSELARSQYQTLLSRAQDLEAQADLQLADSRIVSPALAPQSPSFPNKTLILALAGLAALGLGVALAFLYENLIGGFTTEDQVESVLRTTVATTIPRERSKSEKDSLSNMMVTSPLSVFAESIRRARATIEQFFRARPRTEDHASKVIMVTSTAPNEGKTTLALSLARSYALSGHRTLLIDCDLRKPSIHRHLGMEPSKGLLDFLADGDGSRIALSDIFSQDSLTNVMTIVGARRSDLPTDQLLAGASFGRLIDAARRSFDVVVLDTPPIGPVVDGLYIAPFADAIMYVVRWASTSQNEAKKSISALASAKSSDAEIVVVLNQQDESRGSYQRKYGSYYSYST